MERVLMRLLRVYPITRSWIALSNYMAPLQSVQNTSQMYSTNLFDVTKSLTGKNTYNDVKQQPMEILKIAARDHRDMSLLDAVYTLTKLFHAAKAMKNTDYIRNHIGFVRLCEVLNRNIRLLKISHVIESLKILIYFETPSDTILIQSLLQMIKTNINEMSLHDIMFTSFLLNNMKTTPLRDALLIALPMVFETQLPTKIDTDDISIMTWSLRFMYDYNIKNPNIHEVIIESLWKNVDKLNEQTAKIIFNSLSTTHQLSPMGCKLLFGTQDILITMSKRLSILDIIKILEKISFIVMNKHETIFYNETFVNALINSAMSSDIDYTKGIHILKLLNDLNHVHIPFLEYLATKCYDNPVLLAVESFKKISIFLEGFVNADYKPLFWDTIKEIIIKHKIIITSSDKSLITFALHLIALDCYDPDLLRIAFSTIVRTIKDESLKNVYASQMLLLYQSIKTMYPMYDGPWPQQDLLEYVDMIKLIPPAHSLKPGLERALGGPQYVYNDLKTKLGHYIDHVVVMRKGGYPIAINTDPLSSSITYVEDLQTPSESQKIFIFNLPDRAYAVNSQKIKSTWLLKMKSVEALTKSSTIGINSNSWMKLPEYERIPYLMQAIKLKCEGLVSIH